MISFVTTLKLMLARRFSVQCRIARAEYWWGMLWLLIYCLVSGFIAGFVAGMLDLSETGLGGLVFLVSIPGLIAFILQCIRRAHDVDMSGWWVLLILLPYWGTGMLMGIALVKGNVGPNRFGPDPYTPGLIDSLLAKQPGYAQQPGFQQQGFAQQPFNGQQPGFQQQGFAQQGFQQPQPGFAQQPQAQGAQPQQPSAPEAPAQSQPAAETSAPESNASNGSKPQ
ncbi:MAG: DUF805 domain-containing protein [Anaerobiospirillum sp.]|nr:DUF805 domain-containing protein [Anaerobiospirillum sp.]